MPVETPPVCPSEKAFTARDHVSPMSIHLRKYVVSDSQLLAIDPKVYAFPYARLEVGQPSWVQ